MTPTSRRPPSLFAAPLLALVLAGAALPHLASAQTAGGESLYAAPQAEEGKKVFDASCAMCHGADLAGQNDAPPLSGDYFASSWGGHKVSELLEFVQGNMPMTAPGSLSEETYARVVAYILSRNGLPAGDAPLAKGATGVIAVAKD